MAEASRDDRKDAVVEYARNLDAIWHQPHADTAVGLATHHRELDRGFDLMREAVVELDKEQQDGE